MADITLRELYAERRKQKALAREFKQDYHDMIKKANEIFEKYQVAQSHVYLLEDRIKDYVGKDEDIDISDPERNR